MALTANFYDKETGELIEIKNDRVVARHRSIMPAKERAIVRNQFQTLQDGYMGSGKPAHYEEPYVAPQMFPSDKHEIILQKPKQLRPISNEQEEPYVAPKMTWD